MPGALLLLAALSTPAPTAAATPLPGARAARARYDAVESKRTAGFVSELIRFPTVDGDVDARERQKAWLVRVGAELGLVVRDRGKVTEVELPGPAGSPVLGLIVHGDVQPVEAAAWSVPPFAGSVKGGRILGRGAADDKGPLAQALLAMKSLKEAGPARTHTVRLVVGSDEESTNTDMKEYLAQVPAPDMSLVLDSAFPVVVGEKAWQGFSVTSPFGEPPRGGHGPEVVELEAGLAPSIVPDRARVVLKRGDLTGSAPFDALVARLKMKPLRPGTRLETKVDGETLDIVVRGRSAHAGVNIDGGRNALVPLAELLDGELPACGAADLLAFARRAGQDLAGTGLGIAVDDPLWGRNDVNVATIKAGDGIFGYVSGQPKEKVRTLTINVRRIPSLTAADLKSRLHALVDQVNLSTGSSLAPSGFFDDEPKVFDPEAKLVKRLREAYRRATGTNPPPAISGGGTYAKRLPNAIAFGMWFPGKPYPGHDVDEQIEVADLHRGVHVLLEALVDLACAPPLTDPLSR